MVNKKNDTIVKCENKIEDLMQKNKEKDAIIDKLIRDVKELDKIVKEQISTKKKENENSAKTSDVTSVSNDKKKTLRSSKKKDNIEMALDFATTCINIVDETENDMKSDTDIEIIRQKYLRCTEKIEEEVIAQNVVVDFGLKLMLTNMKLVNENSPKEMINLRIDFLRTGLSNFKVKQENDGKK